MSSQANIVAFDGAATPVSHTLNPVSVVKEKGVIIAVWRESLTSLPDYAQVRCTMRLEQLQKSKVWRCEVRVEVPVMESVSGQNAAGYTAAPAVAYIDTAIFIGLFSQRSSITDHRRARQLAINICGSVSTSVAPVTTGPVPELVDQLIAAS